MLLKGMANLSGVLVRQASLGIYILLILSSLGMAQGNHYDYHKITTSLLGSGPNTKNPASENTVMVCHVPGSLRLQA